MSSESEAFDVCILCALPVEAKAFKRIVEQQCKVSFQEVYRQQGPTYAYYFTTIKNKQGEELRLMLSWLARYGPTETAIQLQSLLAEFRPRFVGMTGICAGDRRKVSIGDLIIAERAFMSDSGKFVLDKDGQQVQEYDTYTAALARDVLQFVRMFDLDNNLTAKLTLPVATERVSPRYHIAPLASSNAVRADNPFDQVRVPVRGTIAIDMEGAAFYQTVEGFPGVRSLVVKGVSDFADGDKDDTYQNYASELSALYMLSFISSYIRSDQKPHAQRNAAPARMGEGKAVPFAVPSATSATVQVPQTGVMNIFFSYARKDERARAELEKQLAMLRRHNKIAFLYSPSIVGGQDVEAETARLMNQSQIILLLISPEYVASDVYDTEVTMACSLYEAGLVRVIPILLRQTSDWEMDFFGKLQPLPKDKRPIYSRSSQDHDSAFYTVAEGIKEVVKQLIQGA